MGKLFAICIALSFQYTLILGQSEPPRVVCYYTNWAQYRTGRGQFQIGNINATLCTHLVYAHAGVYVNFTIRPTEWNDAFPTQWSSGMYAEFNNLKREYPHLQTLLSVGGFALSPTLTRVAQTPGTRAVFIESAIRLLRDWGFDGLDMMWEYPTKRGSTNDDRVKFTNLLQELKIAFEEESNSTNYVRLVLSASVAASKNIIDDAYEIQSIARAVDFLNILTYDFHGYWDGWTGHSSPLYGRREDVGSLAYDNVNSSVNYWIESGVDPGKINVGITPYARTFTIVAGNGTVRGYRCSGPGRPGEITQEAGGLAYYEVCNIARNADIFWDDVQKVPFMILGNQWISFENERSINEKIRFIKNADIGGVMFWNMPSDDFYNSCGSGNFPMLTTLHRELVQNFILPRYAVVTQSGNSTN